MILSDIHFGSELCNAEFLLDVFAQFKFKRLILNGDIFDHLNLEFEERKRHLKAKEYRIFFLRSSAPPFTTNMRGPSAAANASQYTAISSINFIAITLPWSNGAPGSIRCCKVSVPGRIRFACISKTIASISTQRKKAPTLYTHHAEHKKIAGIDYYNSGTIQADVVSYVTLGERGVRIHHFDGNHTEAKVIDGAGDALDAVHPRQVGQQVLAFFPSR